MPAGRDLHAEGADLIRRSFDIARERGASDWRTMTSAVLKNRILELTDRGFEESDWDAGSFGEFLEMFGDIVEVDRDARPPLVRYLAGASTAPVESPVPTAEQPRIASGRSKRIRQDLWDAVLDYSSGISYLWDGEKAVAPEEPDADGPELPTLKSEELRKWREEFVARDPTLKEELGPFLTAWAASERGMSDLPGPIRQRWVEELKNRVAQRLIDWFSEKSIPAPANLVHDSRQRSRPTKDAGELRKFLIDCIGLMDRRELEDLRIPPSIALRAARER